MFPTTLATGPPKGWCDCTTKVREVVSAAVSSRHLWPVVKNVVSFFCFRRSESLDFADWRSLFLRVLPRRTATARVCVLILCDPFFMAVSCLDKRFRSLLSVLAILYGAIAVQFIRLFERDVLSPTSNKPRGLEGPTSLIIVTRIIPWFVISRKPPTTRMSAYPTYLLCARCHYPSTEAAAVFSSRIASVEDPSAFSYIYIGTNVIVVSFLQSSRSVVTLLALSYVVMYLLRALFYNRRSIYTLYRLSIYYYIFILCIFRAPNIYYYYYLWYYMSYWFSHYNCMALWIVYLRCCDSPTSTNGG